MITAAPEEVAAYTAKVVFNLTPASFPTNIDADIVAIALERLEYCFSKIWLKHFRQGQKSLFNYLNGDHYAMFLWFLGNTIWQRREDEDTAVRLSLVNKALHGIDLHYNVQMPDIFLLAHPVGTVVGRAEFSDYLVIYQGVTIGSDGIAFPAFRGPTILYAGAAVIGNCCVEQDVTFGAHALVVNQSIPAHSVVTGRTPDLTVRNSTLSVLSAQFLG